MPLLRLRTRRIRTRYRRVATFLAALIGTRLGTMLGRRMWLRAPLFATLVALLRCALGSTIFTRTFGTERQIARARCLRGLVRIATRFTAALFGLTILAR